MLVSEKPRIWSLSVWHDISRGIREGEYVKCEIAKT